MALDYPAVQQLIYGYWNAMDRRDYPAVLDCLTDDVEWRASSSCEGRAAVAKALEQRPANLVVRHFISNLVVEGGDDRREAFFLIAAFARVVDDGDVAPYPTDAPQVIGDVRATVVATPHGPKIAKLAASVIFRAEQHA